MNLKTLNFNTIIVGCGASGITAAIYLKRAGLNVCIIERNAPGGQLNMISEISNYPGYKSIDGPTLAFNMFEQIRALDIPYKYGIVKEIINEKDYKIVKTDKEELTCENVILSIGRRPKELGLTNEKKLLGRGISYCSICDGSLYKDKEVVVVGGGNSALEGALYLSQLCSKVTLIHRKEEFRGEVYLQDQIKENKNIEIITNKTIKELNEKDNILKSIILSDEKEINCSALFVYVGNIPPSIKCDGLETDNNYIIVDKNMKTNIGGIYACGDIIKKEVYQISTAVGEGSTAALSIIRAINK